MAQVAGPYGFRIVKTLGDLPFSGGMQTYRLTAGANAAFYFGDPIGLVAGQPVAITATPTTAAGPSSPIGIFMGASYIDPKWGFVNTQSLPPNAIAAGYKDISVKIADWPFLVLQIQANGPVTVDKIGMNAALIVGTGNVNTGDSTWALNAASVAATNTLAVRIYGFPYTPAPSPGYSSQPGDAFTDTLVIWNAGVHRLMQPLGQ